MINGRVLLVAKLLDSTLLEYVLNKFSKPNQTCLKYCNSFSFLGIMPKSCQRSTRLLDSLTQLPLWFYPLLLFPSLSLLQSYKHPHNFEKSQAFHLGLCTVSSLCWGWSSPIHAYPSLAYLLQVFSKITLWLNPILTTALKLQFFPPVILTSFTLIYFIANYII